MDGFPALDVRPPAPQPDPIQQVARLVSLRSLLNQQQLQQTQIQLQQRNVESAMALMGAYKQANGDPEKTLQYARDSGKVLPDHYFAAQEHFTKMRTDIATMTDKEREVASNQHDASLGIVQDLYDMPSNTPIETLRSKLGQKLGVLRADPQRYGPGWQQFPNPDQFQTTEQFKNFGQLAMLTAQTHNQMVVEQTKKKELELEERKTAAQERKIIPGTGQVIDVHSGEIIGPEGVLTPTAAESKYRTILENVTAGKPVSDKDLDYARGFELANRKTTTASDTLGVTTSSVSGPSGLAAARAGKGAVPGAGGGTGTTSRSQKTEESLVDLVGQYKASPMLLSRLMYRHPEVLGLVHEKYPDWDETNYDAKRRAMLDLAPGGKLGQQVTSYNTFLRHAGKLWDAIDSLQNSGYPAINKGLNFIRTQTGDPRVQTFLAKLDPVQKEFESFLLNNRALYQDDREMAMKIMDVNTSPATMRSVLGSIAETGDARLQEANNTFKRVTNRDIPNLISPEAQAARDRIIPQRSAKSAENTIHSKSKSGKPMVSTDGGKTWSYE